MKWSIYLAWRYVCFHKVKSAILVLALTLTMVLPLTSHLLIRHYDESLRARANATPLIVGAKGDRFDLVLKALYFGSAKVDTVAISEADRISSSGLARAIPLHLRYTARGYPLVGTSLEYLDFRSLALSEGKLPQTLGQAVVGSSVAEDLGLSPGSTLLSDQHSLYDITRVCPLKMQVTGVLQPTDSADDRAVFVDIKTAWIIDGLMHGHVDVEDEADESVIAQRSEQEIVTNSAIVEYREVTPGNIESFHIHGSRDEMPASAIIVLPNDDKSATLIKARYNVSQKYRMLVPTEVVNELLGLVFKVKRFFDASFTLVAMSAGLFLFLIVLLSMRLRKREMETMHRIGCNRSTMLSLQFAELAIVILVGVLISIAVSSVVVAYAPRLLGMMRAVA